MLALAAIGASGSAIAQGIAPTVEDFFRKPQYGDATLSPSGRYLAVVAPVGARLGLGIINLETRGVMNSVAAGGDGDVLSIDWQTDDRLIVGLGDRQRVEGEPPNEWGTVAIDRDGSNPRVLARRGDPGIRVLTTARRSFERPWSVSVQRTLEGTNEVLVTARERSLNGLDLYRFDTMTGAKNLVTFDSPGFVSHWVVDFDGVPRAAVANDLDRDASAWYVRKSDKDRWTKVEEAKFGRLTSVPMQFDPTGKTLFVSARRNGVDRASIYEYSVEEGRWGNPAISHPGRDVDPSNASFIADYRARKLLGLRYTSDRPSVEWFDAERARIQKSVDAALPDSVNDIQGSPGAQRWIVVAQSDRNPGEVYLLDAKTMRMEKLFSYRPWIDPRAMAATRWIRYSARDGLSIPALLSVPTSAAAKPAPLIVDIHGGPNAPATAWGFDSAVQFFTSRGYAVLQPQFRGTAGFGSKHLTAGYRRWGDEMQDDLEDGVRWAVKQGIADESRVCFYGGSYGGYAAIWGSIKNAGLIRCAIAVAAVTSIDYLFDNAQSDQSRLADRSTLMTDLIGDPKTERARFKRINPLDNAEKVGVPLLLAYGGADVRVPIVHGTDFRSALNKYGKQYEWVQYVGEGHGFNRDEDVFDFYRRVDQFLKRHLQGEASVAAPAAAGK